MKTQLKIILLTIAPFALASCAEEGGFFKTGSSDYSIPKDGLTPSGEVSPEAGEEDSEGQETEILPGQLTCSALDDNKYYDFWKEITFNGQTEGAFYKYRKEFPDSFNTYNRVKLTVNNANDIYVTLKDEEMTYHVDNFHNVYLFPKAVEETYDVNISYLDMNGIRQQTIKTVKNNDVIDLENEYTLSTNLEIMFVIDATGSMIDEMDYIKTEIDDVIGKVKENNPTSKVSLAMMVYRDEGDEYITRFSDFTEDIASQQSWLKQQRADGGGDFEEAVEVALEEAVNKQWSSKGTKLLFHVADAPAHDNKVVNWSNTITKAAAKGIQIMSLAASGINKKTEFFFRSQSILTGGQYIFLTDDSGIGNQHEQPTIYEKLVVEYLNSCLIRLINGYHTGELASPIPYNQTK